MLHLGEERSEQPLDPDTLCWPSRGRGLYCRVNGGAARLLRPAYFAWPARSRRPQTVLPLSLQESVAGSPR